MEKCSSPIQMVFPYVVVLLTVVFTQKKRRGRSIDMDECAWVELKRRQSPFTFMDQQRFGSRFPKAPGTGLNSTQKRHGRRVRSYTRGRPPPTPSKACRGTRDRGSSTRANGNELVGGDSKATSPNEGGKLLLQIKQKIFFGSPSELAIYRTKILFFLF